MPNINEIIKSGDYSFTVRATKKLGLECYDVVRMSQVESIVLRTAMNETTALRMLEDELRKAQL